MLPFVHLHVHSEYSLLDGACRIDDLIDRAVELDMPAIALTDHGAMYGAVDFYKKARAKGIRPIIGCEVYVARGSLLEKGARREEPYHLVLLAESYEGYRNLLSLVSLSHLQGFHHLPRVDREALRQHHKGLIALSGCLRGEVPSRILQGDLEGAKKAADELRELFGSNHFFIELQDHSLLEEKQVNQHLIKIARELQIPVIATNDVHYLYPHEAPIHDVLLCIQTGRTLDDEGRFRFPTDQYDLKSGEQMEALFHHHPDALSNTLAIADRCDWELELGSMHLPTFDLPDGYDEDSYLAEICGKGLQQRYGQASQEAQERLEYELSVIKQMGFAGYFLVVWDFMRFAHEQGISTGPGRGSAAGSLVAYVLQITDVDPIKYKLLFQRFLNPERISWPDIDIDFEYERRTEVIDYVTRKYGEERVAQIITYGTMAARAAIRDVGRVMNLPNGDVDRVARQIPHTLGITIEKALEMQAELRTMYESNPAVKRLIDTALAIEGLPRHTSIHAAGVVISREPLSHYVPLQRGAEGGVVTQYAMEDVEAVGLLKMDFLGLRNLTIIDDTIAMVQKNTNTTIDFSKMDMDDPLTYELLSRGDTDGCFQLESTGVKHMLRELKPTDFEDVIAVISLYRPGPMENIPNYIAAKHGRSPIKYPHPSLQPILKDTYGIIVYQEQIMQIASLMAGFSLGQADLLRRAVGKKKREVLDQQRGVFVQGCVEQGYIEALAHEVYDLIVRFADYGFNRSHAAAYGVLAYRTSYLKAHHPAEFMAALLSSWMFAIGKVAQYVDDCRKMGLKILQPDVNESEARFIVQNGRIRFALAAIKNVGVSAIQAILSERKKGAFKSLDDFCRRVDLRACNRRVIECLVRVGAFDWTGHGRRSLLLSLEDIIDKGGRWQKERGGAQVSLFGLLDTENEGDEQSASYQTIPDFSQTERLEMEKELLGVYVSGHPLHAYLDVMAATSTHRIADLVELQDGHVVTLAGKLQSCKTIQTRKGQTMSFAELEDVTAVTEVVVFPGVYSSVKPFLQKDTVVAITGKLQRQEDTIKLIAESIHPLDPAENSVVGQYPSLVDASQTEQDRLMPQDEHEKPSLLYIRIDSTQEQPKILNGLKKWLLSHPGEMPICLYYTRTKQARQIQERIAATDDFLAGIERLLGPGSHHFKNIVQE